MKSTLLFATLSMVLASPGALAKSELETLRSLCAEQERQIRQLEEENSLLRTGNRPPRTAEAAPVSSAKPAAAPSTASTYTVKAGDNLVKIARKVGTSSQSLAKANGLKPSSIIRPGQKLQVPGAVATSAATPAEPAIAATPSLRARAGGQHKVQPGETFASISRKRGISTADLIAANPQVKPTALRPGQVISLGGDAPATSLISHSKTPVAAAKPAPVPSSVPAVKSPSVSESLPVSTPTATASAVEETAPVASPEKKIRPITVEGEMTYGEFATKYGTDASRLNALNGLDLTTATVLAKGSELYVPGQP